MSLKLRPVIASILVVAFSAATAPAFAAPAPATLTGTVYGDDVKTPLSGATVVVTDVSGAKISSQPTAADGAFTVAAIAPGRTALALHTKDGEFAVGLPVTLAPGETRGVHLALKGKADTEEEKKKKKKSGAYWTAGAVGTMTAVLVGFVAAAVINSDDSNNGTGGNTSPSNPD